ncbi:MAG: hypothetical protein CMA06_01320 [Euryarchaeota archaeon]|nr:hypothetical protein [Euryarchaeota archaeon]
MEPNRLAAIHRHLFIFGLLDIGIFILIMITIGNLGNTLFDGFALGISGLIVLYAIVTAYGFRQKTPNSDQKYSNLLRLLAVFFVTVGVVQGLLSIASNQMILLIQSGLLLLLGRATNRRIKTLRHPMFVQWFSQGSGSSSELSGEEVYASCPNCSSLLAVIPERLSIEDRCPNCEGFLISIQEEE